MDRQDIHSPTNFDPADYEYIGSFDNWPEPGAFLSTSESIYDTPFGSVNALTYSHAEYIMGLKLLRTEGAHIHFFNEQEQEQCDHCGAVIRYVCIYRHKSGSVIAVGETCSTERFGCDDRHSYDVKRLREASKNERERQKLMGVAAEWVKENCPEMEQWLLTPAANDVHSIFADIAGKLVKYGSLSDKQLLFARNLLREHFERQRNGGKTDRELSIEEERVKAEDCPEGRVEITGVVVSTKWVEPFAYGASSTLKLVVKDDRGFAVYVSCPSSIESDTDKGTRLTFTATLTRSDRDSKFGFGKRPTKARILETTKQEVA